jgi:hypothetical protein
MVNGFATFDLPKPALAGFGQELRKKQRVEQR